MASHQAESPSVALRSIRERRAQRRSDRCLGLVEHDEPRGRIAGLDLLRAVAIVWVMIFHATGMGLLQDGDHWIASFGWIGVDLFFVLSGFLIAGQLLQPLRDGRKIEYGKFLQRRALRTFPAYFAVTGLYFLFPAIRETPAIQPFWQFVTFTENIFFGENPKAFSHVWSLCVEEQFYAALPLILSMMLLRPGARKTMTPFLAFIVLGMGIRSWLYATRIGDLVSTGHVQMYRQAYMDLIYYPTWSRLDGLIAGVAAATLKTFRPDHWRRLTAEPVVLLGLGVTGVVATMCLFGGLVTTFLPAVFGYPLLAISLAAIVAAASVPQSIINKIHIPCIQILASCSYSLYLTHKLAFALVERLVPGIFLEGWLGMIPVMLCTFVVCGILYLSVERPFLLLRARLDLKFQHTERDLNIRTPRSALAFPT